MILQTRIDSGEIRGVSSSDLNVTMFRGIPYAQPPVGALRWRAPQPVIPWKGVRDCLEPAAVPMRNPTPQDPRDWGYNEIPSQEDCLYLNVWTPAKSKEEKLPVMVWIFGGGFTAGDSYQPVFEGTKFASRGVVFVSMNYRLDLFGLFAHPEITAQHRADGCTNFGYLDQAAALSWVHRNIAAFGGDPENVTLFGHSAGGGSVINQLISPKTEGLFHKAIVMSGGGIPAAGKISYATLEELEKVGLEFQEWLGCRNLDEVRAIPGPELLLKSREFCSQRPPIVTGPPMRLGIKPVFRWPACVDGDFLPMAPALAILKRQHKNIPIMTGHALCDFLMPPRAENLEDLKKEAEDRFGDRADEYLKAIDFECGDFAKIKENATYANQCVTALDWCQWADECGGFAPMYAYCVDQPRPEDPLGTSHGVDVDYAFDNLYYMRKAHVGADYDVSRQANLYWTNFAKKGDPNGLDHDGTPLPFWTPYTAADPREMHFKGGAHMEEKQPELLRFLISYNLEWHKKNSL